MVYVKYLARNSLSLCLLKIILPSLLKDNFADYTGHDWQVFFPHFSTLNMLFHCFVDPLFLISCESFLILLFLSMCWVIFLLFSSVIFVLFCFVFGFSTIWLWYIYRGRSLCLFFLGFFELLILPFWKWSVGPLSFK